VHFDQRVQKGIRAMICPKCKKPNVSQWHVLGHAGGAAKGASKARTREQAQSAVKARWRKVGTEAAKQSTKGKNT
jgi:hypothetical protein